jgi:hypothetical protein
MVWSLHYYSSSCAFLRIWSRDLFTQKIDFWNYESYKQMLGVARRGLCLSQYLCLYRKTRHKGTRAYISALSGIRAHESNVRTVGAVNLVATVIGGFCFREY